MPKLRWLLVLAALLTAVTVSFADDRAKVLGTWKLVSFERELKATGEKESILGKNPTGYAIFTPEGRAIFILTADGRKAPKTDQDRADLLKSMYAYAGMYRLEANKLIIKPDVSWNPGWVGTEQERLVNIDGERLQIINTSPEKPGVGAGIITWERVK